MTHEGQKRADLIFKIGIIVQVIIMTSIFGGLV